MKYRFRDSCVHLGHPTLFPADMTFLRLRKVAVKTMVMIAMTLNSSSTRVEGFVTLGGRTREAMSMTSASPVPKHIVILPDSRAAMNDSDLWHHHLKVRLVNNQFIRSVSNFSVQSLRYWCWVDSSSHFPCPSLCSYGVRCYMCSLTNRQ